MIVTKVNRNYVLVKLDKPKEVQKFENYTKATSIILTDGCDLEKEAIIGWNNVTTGELVTIGPDAFKDQLDGSSQIGDKVVFHKGSGLNIVEWLDEHCTQRYKILYDKEVFGSVELQEKELKEIVNE
jgi:co-chaperonin GroES (HSP10)